MSAAGRRAGDPDMPVDGRHPQQVPAITSRLSGATGPLMWRTMSFWTAIVGVCAISGAFYGTLSTYGHGAIGAVYGVCCGGAVMLFEQGVIAPRWRARLRELPWLASVIATEIVYVVLVVVGAACASLALWVPGLMGAAFARRSSSARRRSSMRWRSPASSSP